MQQRHLLSMAFFLTLLSHTFAQATLLVPSEFSSIQEALNAAEDGTTILVSPGTYYENLIWPEDADGIELIGEHGKELTIIDGQFLDRAIKMQGDYISLFGDYPKAKIQGFTIKNGLIEDGNGAGLFVDQFNPLLFDLTFQNNRCIGSKVEGAGLFIPEFNGVIQDCEFIGNILNAELGGYGAGLFIATIGITTLKNCKFIENQTNSLDIGRGGGLYVDKRYSFITQNPSIKLDNCLFQNNATNASIWSDGGGAYITNSSGYTASINSTTFINNSSNQSPWSSGGGLRINSGGTKIKNSSFISNQAAYGGGITIGGGSPTDYDFTIERTKFTQNKGGEGGAIWKRPTEINLTLSNCTIDHTVASSYIKFDDSWLNTENTLNLNHCTFAYNSGSIEISEAQLTATNSIFWNNGEDEFEDNANGSEMNLQNCLVSDGFAGDYIIDADPLFIDEFQLIPTEGSPCLSAGISTNNSSDYFGNPRPIPANSYPDIGAYEIDQYFAHIQARFFIDLNEDGVKHNDEPYTSLGSALVNDDSAYNNFREEGIFLIVQPGNVKVTYNQDWDLNWVLTGQSEYSFNVDSEDFAKKIDFGLKPRVEITDVQSVITSGSFRCGEEIDFTLTLKNRGTIVAEGIAWLRLDQRVEEFQFSIAPDYEIDKHLVGWEFKDLYPSQSFDIDFVVSSPLIDNADQVGELYCFTSELEIEDNSRDNNFIYKTEHRCSYDPNDKLVNPYREDSLTLYDSDLIYTIRFQNTGNDYARNVVVTDTMDNNLDLTTFELISTSHPDQLQVINYNRAFQFQFNGIYLQDSISNEPASHGYIHYSISILKGVALNTDITNTAHIYFDFNPAIVTNTTNSILVDEFPTVASQELDELNIYSYPNPSSNTIQLSSTVDKVVVYNAQGKLIFIAKNQQIINVRNLEVGTYFVEYTLDDKIGKDKWVIVR